MNKMYKFIKICVLLVVFTNIGLFGKEEIEPISCDRPDQTESVNVLPKGFIQLETGFAYEQINENVKGLAIPSMLLKYGILDKMELRLIVENTSTTTTILDNETKVSGLSPLALGVKIRIQDEDGIIPAVALLGHLSIPELASEDFKLSYYAPDFRFSMQHTLSESMSLGYNLGAQWDGETAEPQFVYTIVTGLSITDELGAFVELYGFAPQNSSADHRLDGGITYLLSNNMMVDVAGGFGLNEIAPEYFVGIGFSFRLPR